MNHNRISEGNAQITRILLSFLLIFLASCSIMDGKDEEDLSAPAAGMLKLAGLMREKGDMMGALDFYQRALLKEPNNAIALKETAFIYDALGDKQTALGFYREAAKTHPDNAEFRKNYGRALLAQEMPMDARREFEAALETGDKDPKALNGLGIALDYLGEHDAAQKKYEEALEMDEGNLSILNNLAYSYILTGSHDAAIKLLEPELKNPAATAAMRQNLALAYGMSGMDADAERIAKIDLSPKQVKENMAYYKRKRAEIAVETVPYAELGSYATEALAVAKIEKLQESMDDMGVDLKPVISPEVAAPGGTPRFKVKMMGCTKPDDVQILCAQLAKLGVPCVAKGK